MSWLKRDDGSSFMKAHRNLLWFLMLVLTPSVLMANVGTALMWAPIIHLLFGNVLLGILEAFLLVKIFKAPKWQSVWVMILANYFSAWIGMEFLIEYFVQEQDITIENVKHWLRVFWWAAFGITLLAEFPFIWFSLRNQKRAFLTALKATGILHCLSYALLFWWYNSASVSSMVKDLELVSPSELVPSENYVLCYISQDGKTVQKMNLDGAGKSEQIFEISTKSQKDYLVFHSFDEDAGFDLYLRQVMEDNELREIEVVKSLSNHAIEYAKIDKMTIQSLADETQWEYYVVGPAALGILGYEKDGDKEFRYALETLIASWGIGLPIHMTDNFLVFQLGPDQICILDHESKKIALLARGRYPIVATAKD